MPSFISFETPLTSFILHTSKGRLFKTQQLIGACILIWNTYTLSLGSSKGRFSQPLPQKVIQWVTAINGSALKFSLLLQRIKANEETVSRLGMMVN